MKDICIRERKIQEKSRELVSRDFGSRRGKIMEREESVMMYIWENLGYLRQWLAHSGEAWSASLEKESAGGRGEEREGKESSHLSHEQPHAHVKLVWHERVSAEVRR